MAHIVKCLYCGQKFDADKEEYVKPNTNRYAHQKCAEEYEKNGGTKKGVYQLEQHKEGTSQKEEHKIFFDCIRDITLNRSEVDWAIVTKEEKRLLKAGYSLSGLTKTFYYLYAIKNKPLPDKVDFLFNLETYYEQAKDYYKKVFLINQKNKEHISNLIKEENIINTSIRETNLPIKFFNIGE